jgi:hypothetical protein
MRLKIPLSRYLTRSTKANAPKTMSTAGSIQSDMRVLRADSSTGSKIERAGFPPAPKPHLAAPNLGSPDQAMPSPLYHRSFIRQPVLTSMTIAAIYARKSTEQTGVADEQKSVARQVENARAFAAAKGLGCSRPACRHGRRHQSNCQPKTLFPPLISMGSANVVGERSMRVPSERVSANA